jgi:hypothetical protein
VLPVAGGGTKGFLYPLSRKPLSRNTAQVPLGFSAALLAVIVNV